MKGYIKVIFPFRTKKQAQLRGKHNKKHPPFTQSYKVLKGKYRKDYGSWYLYQKPKRRK